MAHVGYERDANRVWLREALDDAAAWEPLMQVDADGHPVDWAWVRGLDLEHGIGEIADLAAIDAADAQTVHDALRDDLATRDRLESVLADMTAAFMRDWDRSIASFRLARALGYANRRLCDEIGLLRDRGAELGMWHVETEEQGRVRVPVLRACDGSWSEERLQDVQDRSGEIVNARAERRKEQAQQRRRPFAPREAAASAADEPDWRDAYLPGRDIDAVMGIDIETTGVDQFRDAIIDIGFEFMAMASSRPVDPQSAGYAYEQRDYAAGDAYGQARLRFGVTAACARRGNAFIRELTGIDVRELGDASMRMFDDWPAAQSGLLRRMVQQPYVAHNASFEHKYFMANIAGYAEAYRAGDIVIVDTLPMSRRWDPGSVPSEEHPHGDNTLDAYAKRQGALDPSSHERHLGLEDAHIMLVAMKHHLASLRAAGQGPWSPSGRAGVGGKRIGSRR